MNTRQRTERTEQVARTVGGILPCLAILGLLAALPKPALGVDYNDIADGNWSTPGSWNVGSGYPDGTDDTATIDETRTLDVDVSVAIGSLTVTNNAVQTLNATTPNTLTVNTFSSGNTNNFTIGSGLSLNIAGTGEYVTRGGTVNGTLNVLNGATLTYTMNQEQRGSGTIHVQPGGKIDIQSNSSFNPFDGATGLTVDNDGLFEFNNSGTFIIKSLNITGDGEWKISSGGVRFDSTSQTIALTPATATWTGDAGMVQFYQASTAVTHTLGGFDMGGSNTVQFARGATYQINGSSTFQDLTLTSEFSTGSVDLAPDGGGAKIHAVNGTLALISGTLTASDAGGAVLNANHFTHTSSGATVTSGVTLNIGGIGSWIGNGSLTLDGNMNLQNGASLLVIGRELYGSGTLNVASGATLTLDGTANNTRRINVNVVNDGLVKSVNNNIRPFYGAISGTGTFLAESGTLDLDQSTVDVAGWGDGSTGTFASQATWHAQGTGIIDFRGSDNSIATIGADATIILEDGGKVLQLSNSARNNLTVNGALHVRGSSILAFNANQSLTVASGGILGGDGTISTSGTGQILVQSGGTLSPGNSIGTLNITGPLTLAGTAEVELGTPGTPPDAGLSDLTDVTGDLTLTGGTLQLADNAGADGNGSAAAGHYRLITFGGSRTGELATVTNDTSLLAKVVYNGDANGSVDLELWDHGVASFASDSILASLTLDFGEVAGGSGSHSQGIDLYNLLQTVDLTAGLDMTWLLTSSDAAPLSTDLAALDNLAGGGSQGFLAFLDANLGAGVFSEIYQLTFTDNTTGLYGAANPAQILTLTLTGTVLLIPEPASLALLAAGGLLAGRRRRK